MTAGPPIWARPERLVTSIVGTCFLTLVLLIAPIVSAQDPPKLRLPPVAAPDRYNLALTIVPNTDTFDGEVDIALTIRESTTVLWLNASDLLVKGARFHAAGREMVPEIKTAPEGFVGFVFQQAVQPGLARLHITYQGQISRKGFSGVFQVRDGDQWYVFTHFEPTDARRAFPCFDEPSYKVPWQLTLRVRKDDLAFTNTSPVAETRSSDDFKTVRFAESKPMPSYLVTLAVGPFDVVEGGKVGKNAIPSRVIVPRGRTNEAGWAIESTPQIVRLLEDYFGTPYPFDKLDQIAMPLAGGAMEHPGLISYGQSLILSKPELDTAQRRRTFASVCAHEIAHQWFGNLVTMMWWDDIWLNEGFATWMEGQIVDRLKPEWQIKVSGNRAALAQDSLLTARKVRQPIESQHDIQDAFDGITYDKGAALLAMFESYLGPSALQKGIRQYLNRHAWQNATSQDFLAAIGSGRGAVVARAFSTFLDQAGAPLLKVLLQCEGSRARLTLEQQRYLPSGSKAMRTRPGRSPCASHTTMGKAERASACCCRRNR